MSSDAVRVLYGAVLNMFDVFAELYLSDATKIPTESRSNLIFSDLL
jgi:hypothetical protein